MARSNSRRQQDTIDLSLERGQVTTLVVGSVLALGAVFLLGVGYGRSLAEAPAGQGEARAQAEDARPEPEVPALTFHDALTSERIEPEAAPPSVAHKPAAEPQKVKAAAEADAAPASATEKAAVAKSTSSAAKPEAEVAEADRPSAAKPAAAPADDPGFTVQVASSRERDHTERLAEKLKAAGYDARVVPADIPGRGRWYRVRVGSYGSRDAAALAQADLKVALDLSGIVVAN